jgi:hypothetical protein
MPDNQPVTKADFEAGMKAMREYIDERTRDMQTELLRGFRVYQEGTSVRMAKLTADVSNIDAATDKRLNLMEERLLQLERRISEKGL